MAVKRCLTPGCIRLAWNRGACKSCYSRHAWSVRQGKTTWAELEAVGLVRPAQSSFDLGRKWRRQGGDRV